jgi:hypothetical protein
MSVIVGALFGLHRHLAGIGQIAQSFQTIAEAVRIVIDRQNAEFAAPRLGVEAEEDPIDEDECLMPEVFRGDLPLATG